MEASEIHEFREQVEKGGEANLRYVSLVISVLAVMVAMVTVLGHRTHTEAVLMQTRAADQWNEYQAKKIRQNELSLSADLLSLQPNANQVAVEKKLEEYKGHIEKWSEDLNEEQNKAREFEDEVRRSEARASRFDLGEALLQIAVVLSSITLLTRRPLYVLFGVALGLGGLLISASAWMVR